jgi:DNA polymerase gamma 1
MTTERSMPRLTELGYPVLEENLHHRVFGKQKPAAMSCLQKRAAENLLKQFDIQTPVDYPENLYDGPLPLPDLRGESLTEHFEKVALDQVGQYKEWAEEYATCKLPQLPPPEVFKFEPGWTRYEWVENEAAGGWYTESVPYPEEEAFTFDCETYVHGGAFPIIGTALSAKAAYVWLAAELIDPAIPEEKWDQHALIPVGRGRFIAGHNISYDRVRAREGYSLENTEPENFYFDTLSAHIGVSGLASGQRWLYILAGKNPEDTTEEEKRKLKYAPKWLNEGSTNSLVATYNFHVYEVRKYFGDNVEPLGAGDKAVRDIFVKATHLAQIRQVLTEAVDYALKDAFYTAELFQAIWPKYLDSTPSPVALCGHYHLNGSVVPLVPQWEEWIQNVERVYSEHNEEMTQICKDLVWQTYEDWKEADDKEHFESHDPWLSQLNWEVKTVKGKYANVPNWVRPFVKDPDEKIGVKSRLAHLLLKLEWEGKPIVWVDGEGWCVWEED